jgi:hypothetical protein
VAAWVPYMFWNFYYVENHKIVNNPTTTGARAKISTHLEAVEFENFLMYVILNLKTIKFYLIKLAADF